MPQNPSFLETVNKLYQSESQKNIKIAFDLFEKEEWTLQKIITFVIQNHKKEKQHNLGIIKSRSFYIGPVHFYFDVADDWEALDTHSNYTLSLTISLLDLNKNIIVTSTLNNLLTKEFDSYFGPNDDNEDLLSFFITMEEYTWKVLEHFDCTKTKNLYDELSSFYLDFLTLVNNGDIIV